MVLRNRPIFQVHAHQLVLFFWLAGLACFPRLASAHIEYFDLNQGKQIIDLTTSGKTWSTSEYGANPIVTGDGVGLAVNTASDRPINDQAHWTASFQTESAVGLFSDITYSDDRSTANVVVNDVTDLGWGKGTRLTLGPGMIDLLGDSHKVDFFNFRLVKASRVTITWLVGIPGKYYDGGFTLYRGVAPYQAHDDGPDILNPMDVDDNKVQSAMDSGTIRDAQGILILKRDTANFDYSGQFNALGNWSQANVSGNWGALSFVSAVNNKVVRPTDNGGKPYLVTTDDSLTKEILTIVLAPGNYTIAASGAAGAVGYNAANSTNATNLKGQLTYTADAVDACP